MASRRLRKKREKRNEIKLYSEWEGISYKSAKKIYRKKSYKSLVESNNGYRNFWEQKLELPNKQRWYFAYRDYSGEVDINDQIANFNRATTPNLLAWLEYLVTLPPTYRKKTRHREGSGSSGAGGDYKMLVGTQKEVIAENNANKKRDRKAKLSPHWRANPSSGLDSGYQNVKTGRYNSFAKFTPRKLLVIATAIMTGVTEFNRISFYRDFYARLNHYFPGVAEKFPRPYY